MLGAIVGDVVGSRFEWRNLKSKEFELFHPHCEITDDSVMTLAIAEAVLDSEGDLDRLERQAVVRMQELGRAYDVGYGGRFGCWIEDDDPQPYNSWGNGSAMRVSACAYAADSLPRALAMARRVTVVTHNHPLGMRGAEAVTEAIYLARTGLDKEEIHKRLAAKYYPLDCALDVIRPYYRFDVSCEGSVPWAIRAFLESTDFEDAVRTAISIGGDSDTIAAITGSIAEAYYGIPDEIRQKTRTYLDERLTGILDAFEAKFGTYPAKK